jgi:antitoxin (DNA-binding transcriptional repressor) of toxin-antitoxin stability system
MSVVNVDEVKRDLSRHLEQVAQGEHVVFASVGTPVAKLVAYQAPAAPQVPGYWVRIAADFDVLPPEVPAASAAKRREPPYLQLISSFILRGGENFQPGMKANPKLT